MLEVMNRTIVAFIVAPLWVPLAAGVIAYISSFDPYPTPVFWTMVGILGSALTAYVGEFALGLPVFLILRSHGMSRLWIVVLFGCIIGAVCGVIYWASIMFFFSAGDIGAFIGAMQKLFNGHGNLIQMSLAPSLLGAIAGATLWLIARPDKRPNADTWA
jgi:hypothetical protein